MIEAVKSNWKIVTLLITTVTSTATGAFWVAKAVPTTEELNAEVAEVKLYVDIRHEEINRTLNKIQSNTLHTNDRIDDIYNHLVKKKQ